MRVERVRVAPAETLAVFSRDLTRATETTSANTAVLPSVGAVTVVLLPGPIGSAYSMRRVTDALAAQHVPVMVIDPLGMGASARPASAEYSLTRQASRVGAVLDSLHVGRVVIVAQGTSATIALHLAADRPTRVASIVSLSGGLVDRQGTRGVRLALALAPVLDNVVGRSIGRRKFVAAMREQSSTDAWITDDVVHAYLEPYEQNLRGALRALRAMNDAVEPLAIAERLPTVTAHVRLLIGDKRSGHTPSEAQIAQLQRGLAHFSVDTVAGAGTMLQEERPDAVVQAIRRDVMPPTSP
jgi:pimeloyl-ACP methyl ester carboxylesterase